MFIKSLRLKLLSLRIDLYSLDGRIVVRLPLIERGGAGVQFLAIKCEQVNGLSMILVRAKIG